MLTITYVVGKKVDADGAPVKSIRYFAQRSPQTGDLVSRPNSKFMPSNIQTYPTLICKNLKRKNKWESSRKAL